MLECKKLKDFEKPESVVIPQELEINIIPTVHPSDYEYSCNDLL